jgi:DNA-directed RNA polymerase beta subunit
MYRPWIECIQCLSLKAKYGLICNDTDNEDFALVEQEVFLGKHPYMTNRGSSVINEKGA